MSYLKRFELWLLLICLIVGLVWVFRASPGDPSDETDSVQSHPTASSSPLVLQRITVERDYGNARLDLSLRITNEAGDKLLLASKDVKLTAGKDREVPLFYLPFEPPPEIPARATQEVQLRYWLEAKDLQGPLTLTVQGKHLEIKKEPPFDLNTLTNGDKKVFTTSQW